MALRWVRVETLVVVGPVVEMVALLVAQTRVVAAVVVAAIAWEDVIRLLPPVVPMAVELRVPQVARPPAMAAAEA